MRNAAAARRAPATGGPALRSAACLSHASGARDLGLLPSAQFSARARPSDCGVRGNLSSWRSPTFPLIDWSLAVEPQQVVLGYAEATDGRIGFQATMWAMPIVAMEPMEQLNRPLIRVVVGASVGPFTQCCLNEAFGLSIGLRSVRLREDLTKAAAFAGGSEAF